MARPKQQQEDEVESNGKGLYRISFTVDQPTSRNIRLASALADMDKGEWIVMILEKAAEKAVAGFRR